MLPQPMNNRKFIKLSFQPRQMIYDNSLILSLLPKFCIFKMWIPRYIDMNPHFRQSVVNKGIFKMWIRHYIDMYPHYVRTYKSRIP